MYKRGDKVRVTCRSTDEHNTAMIGVMDARYNSIVTITTANTDERGKAVYSIEEDGYTWDDNCFSPFINNVTDKVIDTLRG